MSSYFKYKPLNLDAAGRLDERSIKHVIEPIAESYFYLPSRSQLNDPNEGVFKNQLQTGINTFLQNVTAFGERAELSEALYDAARQIVQSADNSGVFSLSKNPIDELMWSHYGNSHCGLVIEYDLDFLKRFSPKGHIHCFDVCYKEHPPILDLRCLLQNADEVVRAMLGHKSPRWCNEEEFRVLLDNLNGQVPHDFRAARSITFGLNVSREVRAKIYEMTKKRVSNFFEVIRVQGSYRFEKTLLEDFPGNNPATKNPSIDWSRCFENVDQEYKEKAISIAQEIVSSDPHFKELVLAELSTVDPSQAVVQYEVEHSMELSPCSKYINEYFPLWKCT
ncbi:MAG: DUF2971 domain-containing protein [Pseudomonadota bacterium]